MLRKTLSHSKPKKKLSAVEVKKAIQLRKKAGKSLIGFRVLKEAPKLHQAVLDIYGRWDLGVVAAGYDYQEIRSLHFTRREIKKINETKKEIKKIFKTEGPMSQEIFRKRYPHLYNALKGKVSYIKIVKEIGHDYEIARLNHSGMFKWTKGLIEEKIKERFNKRLNLIGPKVLKEDSELYSAALRKHENWADAVNSAGFNYKIVYFMERKRKNWTEKKVLADLMQRIYLNKSLTQVNIFKENQELGLKMLELFTEFKKPIKQAQLLYKQIKLAR